MKLLPFNYSIDILMSRKINKYYYVVITGGIFGLTYLAKTLTNQCLKIFWISI